ncbi:DNA-binding response regulator [Streptococcus pneumoniae]|nr:DNA-binding response regulator [Streptococcus pneumoniae]
MNILVADDEEMIREGIAAFLTEEGYHVIVAKDGQEALEKFQDLPIHLMVLDLMMPRKSGFEVLKEINRNHDIPVIVLSALGDEETQMQVFDLYADDHVTKPFSLVVLVKRIQALLRRYYVVEDIWHYQDVTVDFTSYKAHYKNEEIDLKPKELLVLKCLIQHKNQVLSREQILEEISKDVADLPCDRVVDVYIRTLRKKLALDCIVTVKNVGYKISL